MEGLRRSVFSLANTCSIGLTAPADRKSRSRFGHIREGADQEDHAEASGFWVEIQRKDAHRSRHSVEICQSETLSGALDEVGART